ncbi:MAG: septum formation initiator family protein [Opitutales bacterium]|nr:septum formation initiator family protein [Opitutales bacterium]
MTKWTSRLFLSVVWTGIGGALLLSTVTFFKLLPASKRERDYQRERIAAIEEQIRVTERSLMIKREFLDQLNTNPRFLERVARQRLHMVRPGDTIIHLEEQKDKDAADDTPNF